VHSELITPGRELSAEQLGERLASELDLLQAHHVGLSFVEPRQQPGNPLLDRVDVPGRYPHPSTIASAPH